MTRRIFAAFIVCGFAIVARLNTFSAQEPRAGSSPEQISFTKTILPILQENCLTCHGEALQLSKLDLRTRESALKGGDRGPAIVAGSSEQSRMYRRIAGLEEPSMPMDG